MIAHVSANKKVDYDRIIEDNNKADLIVVAFENEDKVVIMASVKWLVSGESLDASQNWFAGQRLYNWGSTFLPTLNRQGKFNGLSMIKSCAYRALEVDKENVTAILDEFSIRINQINNLLNSTCDYQAINIDPQGRGKTEYVRVFKVIEDNQKTDVTKRLFRMMGTVYPPRRGLRWDYKRQAIAIRPGYSMSTNPCQYVLEQVAELSFDYSWNNAPKWATSQLNRKAE